MAACPHLSQHRARHCCSLLLRLLLGFVTHLSKHLSRTVCRQAACRAGAVEEEERLTQLAHAEMRLMRLPACLTAFGPLGSLFMMMH